MIELSPIRDVNLLKRIFSIMHSQAHTVLMISKTHDAESEASFSKTAFSSPFNLLLKIAIVFSSILSLPSVFMASITITEVRDINDISRFVLCLNERTILSQVNFLYGPSLTYDHTTGTCYT